MDRFANAVIHRSKAVISLFIAATAVCALLYFTVRVNYNMTDYLPREAQSTKALEMMDREFRSMLPNAEAAVRNVSLMEALALKNELKSLEHVIEVIWLDDAADITQPLEMGDKDLIEGYYKDGNARFSIVIEKDHEKDGIAEIRELTGGAAVITGEAADIEYMQSAAGSEVLNIMLFLIPIIVLILVLSTTSWIEPLLFLAAIGVSVVINMGTNAFFGSISFVTNSITPILQLAVSLDYAIFLLHSFGAHRASGLDVGDAMRKAVRESFSTVAASALTTLFGFMALMVMDFRIGVDLGLSLAKGIVFSFISVMVFLPALTICAYRAIDKTRHRALMPAFSNIHGILRRAAIPVVAIIAVIIVPCFLGQSRTDFLYGYLSISSTESDGTGQLWDDSTVMALLVPRGDATKEELLCDDILDIPRVTSVMSYVKTVGSGIPPEFLDASIAEQFYSANLARIIVSVNTQKEGETAFEAVELITAAAEKYYPGEVYSTGQSANTYDIKNVVRDDNRLTNMIAIIAIFAVLVVTFKSASLPLLLLFTIESAIWINLSIPFFTGSSINYIGYLVLNTVQLGATVDYAILLTVTYTRNRRSMPKKEAIHKALGSSFRSILVSAATLATAGFTLAASSSIPIVADIGMLLGRGTLLSMLMVVVFLPAMMTLFDKFIGKTTYKSEFLISAKGKTYFGQKPLNRDEKPGGSLKMKRAKKLLTMALVIALVAGISAAMFTAGSGNAGDGGGGVGVGVGVANASASSGGEGNENGNGSANSALTSGGSAAISEKDEVVYARLSGGGEARNIYVVNHLTLSAGGVLSDFGDYTSVVNLTDLQPLIYDSGEVSAMTDSEDFFYQGYLAERDLPWTYGIEYTLNGQITQPENLAGQSGKLEIRVTSAKNRAIDETFYNNYMQQITITLDINKCKNINANGATVANAGKNRVLVFTVLPGNDADFTIAMDADDFEMEGIGITAVPYTMNVEIPDTGAMLDDFGRLSDAIAELNDGVGKLKDGAAEMADGATKLKNGSSDFNWGLSRLSGNSEQLTEASAQIQGALSQIATSAQSAAGSSPDSAFAELALLPAGLSQLADGLSQVSGGMNQLKNGYAQAYAALDNAIAGIPDSVISEEQLYGLIAKADDSERILLNDLIGGYTAAMTVKGTYEQVKTAFASVTTTLDTLASSVDAVTASLRSIAEQIGEALSGNDSMAQIQRLITGISQLSASYGEFHGGLIAYAQGVSDLANGYVELNSGAASFSAGASDMYDGVLALYDGTSQMAEETSGLTEQFRDEIDRLMGEYTGGDFEAVSFTSSRNRNISFVQFVFMTDSIEKPKDETVYQNDASQLSFWDRLINLFR